MLSKIIISPNPLQTILKPFANHSETLCKPLGKGLGTLYANFNKSLLGTQTLCKPFANPLQTLLKGRQSCRSILFYSILFYTILNIDTNVSIKS